MDKFRELVEMRQSHAKSCEECKMAEADKSGKSLLCDEAGQINAKLMEMAIFGQTV